jgi:hypothetical protein
LRADVPHAQSVRARSTSSPVKITVEDVLRICSANKTISVNEDDIKKLSAYAAGPGIDAESLRRVIVELVSGVPKQWEPRFKLCCVIRSSVNESIEGNVGPENQLKRGRALFDRMLEEQCQELLFSWGNLRPEERLGVPSNDQLEVAQFVAHVAEEGLFREHMLIICKNHLSSLNIGSDPAVAARLCSLLTFLGKVLDQGAFSRFMNTTFGQLQRLADQQDHHSVHKDIHICLVRDFYECH